MKTRERRPKILLCVTGSVAAYKAAALARRLSAFADVMALLTPAAAHLVRPSAFRSASGVSVAVELFKGVKPIPPGTPSGALPVMPVPHIDFARDCDMVLVAPATADFLGKLAWGLADDLASSACLYASSADLWAAPAMNPNMWKHPAVQANVRVLNGRGATFIGPDAGPLACGDEGLGRMTSPDEIARRVEEHFRIFQQWRGMKVLVTAGPTREFIDPVRVLTNRSSGRMGYALAEAFSARGADVLLVTGPTALATPPRVKRLEVQTAREMHRAVLKNLSGIHLAVMSAAVADYRPASESSLKIKKGKGALTVRLIPNPDILADVLKRRTPALRVVGFAAETDRLDVHARAKLLKKPCDVLAANLVGKHQGMETIDNQIRLYLPGQDHSVVLGKGPKPELAGRLADFLQERFRWNARGWAVH
jgi:phosphopantothenoylcysteine decarboxylase/phosphopantothenate--cysteine ligase